MIWATVSSRSYFCWLYRASPSLAAKDIINLISVLTILWYPCVESSRVFGRGCLLWPVHFLGKTLSLCPASFRIPRPNLSVTPGVSWLPIFASQSAIMKRTSFLGVSSKRSFSLHWTIQLQLLQRYWLGHRLGLLWSEWFSLEMNRDHSVIFEIASKYCISDSFVDYDGYSISSEGFLPTVVDIMVIIWWSSSNRPAFKPV